MLKNFQKTIKLTWSMLDLMYYNVLKVQKIVNLGKSFILGKAN